MVVVDRVSDERVGALARMAIRTWWAQVVVNLAVQPEVGDAAVSWVPILAGGCPAQDRIKGVDGWLPQV
jgi:hypothetical protein